jgi:hypothetical protein
MARSFQSTMDALSSFPFVSAVLRRDTEFLVKGLGLGLAPEEFLEDVHFFLGAATLEDGVAVAAALLRVHGVGLEDGVEHVCGVDLRGEVSVVTIPL